MFRMALAAVAVGFLGSGIAHGGISASVSDLTPCDEEVQVTVNCSAKYVASVSAGETNSWRFKIRLESVYDATSAVDAASDFEVDVAPGNSISNGSINLNWNHGGRTGEHTLSVTVEARELTEGGPPTAFEGAASQICTYTVTAGGAAAKAGAPEVNSSIVVPEPEKKRGGTDAPRVGGGNSGADVVPIPENKRDSLRVGGGNVVTAANRNEPKKTDAPAVTGGVGNATVRPIDGKQRQHQGAAGSGSGTSKKS